MITYGYVKQYMYTGDGTLMIQVRIPSIHGAMNKSEYNGKTIRNYTEDGALPWYQSVLLPHLPNEGEVVMLLSTNSSTSSSFVIIGLTGGAYTLNSTDLER